MSDKKGGFKRWLERNDRKIVHRSIYGLLATILLYNIGLYVFIQNWSLAAYSFIILLLVLLPFFLKVKTKFPIPLEVELMSAVFIFATLFLGEISHFYHKYWWWDRLLHFSSGILLVLIGFVIIYLLYGLKRLRSSAILIVLFSFCFAIAIGGVWEVIEFIIDSFLGTNMQRSLYDTNWDLIMDIVGAALSSVGVYLYLTSGFRPLDNLVRNAKKNK